MIQIGTAVKTSDEMQSLNNCCFTLVSEVHSNFARVRLCENPSSKHISCLTATAQEESLPARLTAAFQN